MGVLWSRLVLVCVAFLVLKLGVAGFCLLGLVWFGFFVVFSAAGVARLPV